MYDQNSIMLLLFFWTMYYALLDHAQGNCVLYAGRTMAYPVAQPIY